MKLKYRLTKAAYDKLGDEVKAHYRDDGEEGYVLDVEGLPSEDAGPIRRARDREKTRREEVEAELAEARDQIETLTGEVTTLKAKKSGKDTDIERLEKQWQDRVTAVEQERDALRDGKDATIRDLMVNSAADRLAAEISTSPKVMRRHIIDRLTVDFDADTPSLVVLDKDGKPSKLTTEELGKEFVADKDFSAIITGIKARGSVTPDNPAPGAGGTPGQHETPNLAAMDGKALAAHLKASKEAAGS